MNNILEMKMKNKKIMKNILIFLGFVLMATGNVLIQELSNLDEIWIFNIGRCISNGLLPYKDISMIVTPLYFFICAGLFKIFGAELLVLRIFECIQTGAILFLIYKILERLKIHKGIALACTTRILLFIIISYLCRL